MLFGILDKLFDDAKQNDKVMGIALKHIEMNEKLINENYQMREDIEKLIRELDGLNRYKNEDEIEYSASREDLICQIARRYNIEV